MASKLNDLRAKRAESQADKGKKGDRDLEMGNSGGDSAKQFDLVKLSIKTIRSNTDEMRKLNDRAMVSVNEQKEIMVQIEDLVGSTKAEGIKCKEVLTKLHAKIDSSTGTQGQIERNMLKTNEENLTTAIREYQEAVQSIHESVRGNITRQLQIVGGKMTDAQIDEAMASNDPGLILRHAMGVSDQALDAVAELEERHERMRKIEQGVRELAELFQDMALLVEVQGEMIDSIEQNVSQAKTRTKEAEVNILQAKNTQTKNRKVVCGIFAVLLVILVIVILATQAGK